MWRMAGRKLELAGHAQDGCEDLNMAEYVYTKSKINGTVENCMLFNQNRNMY